MAYELLLPRRSLENHWRGLLNSLARMRRTGEIGTMIVQHNHRLRNRSLLPMKHPILWKGLTYSPVRGIPVLGTIGLGFVWRGHGSYPRDLRVLPRFGRGAGGRWSDHRGGAGGAVLPQEARRRFPQPCRHVLPGRGRVVGKRSRLGGIL